MLRNRKIKILFSLFIIILAIFGYNRISFNMTRNKSISALKMQLFTIPELGAKYRQEGTSLVLNNVKDTDLKVSIGDAQDKEFKPELNINKWDGEVKFKLSPGIQEKNSKISFEKDVIKLENSAVDYRVYDVNSSRPQAGTIKDGAFEFDAIIKEKPQTNVFTWNIETENLDFFYQPPLNEEKESQKGTFCTETECKDKDGNITIWRPENVVGSYAVYYKGGKSGDYSQMGGKNYKTGKAFHIYRPLITDATGKTIWGVLNVNIKNQNEKLGTLTVTVPQSFLDSATYPVTVDPTLGYTSQGASSFSIAYSMGIGTIIYREGNLYTATESGVISDLNIYAYTSNSSNVNGLTTLAVNQKDSMGPNSHGLIGSGEALLTYLTSISLLTINNLSINISAGTPYIINVSANTENLSSTKYFYVMTDSVLNEGYYMGLFVGSPVSEKYAMSLENPWNQPLVSNDLKFSLYATYTASGGAGGTPVPSGVSVKGGVKFKGGVGINTKVASAPSPWTCGTDTVTDADSNVYNTVLIGDQCWMAENLRTTKKPNGDNLTSYCNPSGCASPWGRLYNWSVAMNGSAAASGTGAKIQGICPSGWHIPSDYNADANDDWQKLSNYLGGDTVSGGHLKEAGTTNWTSPNIGADNSSNFTAIPAGFWYSGSFYDRGEFAYFWSSSEGGASNAWNRYLYYNNATVYRNNASKSVGFAVRCLKD